LVDQLRDDDISIAVWCWVARAEKYRSLVREGNTEIEHLLDKRWDHSSQDLGRTFSHFLFIVNLFVKL